METKKKTALITGGSRGLGRDMAMSLAKNNVNILITYHRNATKAEEVVNEIKALGQEAAAFQLDTANTKSFDAFIAQITNHLKDHENHPNFDFLINNAGTALYAPFMQTTEEQFDEMVNIHHKGIFFLTQKALPYMNDGGRIINISSGLARFSLPGSSTYASMKGAVEVLTRYLAKELGDRKITANVVAPGAIETDFGNGHVRDDAKTNAMVAQMTALGRAGVPEDIGGVVAFLCSPEARWVNGQRIEVSGGMNL